MANIEKSLEDLMSINGALGASVVDYVSGMSLGALGGAGLDLELAAAGNAEVVKAKQRTMDSLGIEGGIQDILITLAEQMHIIRPCPKLEGIFIYLALDSSKANLALSRRKVLDVEGALEI